MKTNHIIKSALALIVAAMSGSCSDFLNEEPKGIVTAPEFYTNEQQVRQAVNGIYRRMANSDVMGYEVKQLPCDLLKRASWDEAGGLGNFTYGAENSYITKMWQGHYSIVKDCNSTIDAIEANKSDIDNADRYLGQARGVRAIIYFDLARWFGAVPLVLKAPTDLDGLEVERTPVKQVFDQIVADLEFAALNAPETRGDGWQYGRFSSEAAHGYLSKVYMWMASVDSRDNTELFGKPADNYRKALDHSELVIRSGKFSLVPFYPDVFNAKTRGEAQKEVLFTLEGLTGDNTGTWTGMVFGIRGSQEKGGSWDNISSSDYHRMIYEPSDSVRRLWNCPRVQLMEDGRLWGWDYRIYWDTRSDQKLSEATENNNWVQWSIGKFRRYPLESPSTYNYTNFGMDEPLLRYADVLLTYAEAYNEVNHSPGAYTASVGTDLSGVDIASAYDAVNLVRRRARIANKGILHEDPLPRELKLELASLNGSCVPDWRPGFYGYIYDGVREASQAHGYGGDYDSFRNEILEERGRELVAEGTDRWCDLVRRGLLEAKMQGWRSYNPFVSSEERNILTPGAPENVSRKHYLLPIPLSEMDVNKKLTQNPGY